MQGIRTTAQLTCKHPGCTAVFSSQNPRRPYCDEHQRQHHAAKRKRDADRRAAKRRAGRPPWIAIYAAGTGVKGPGGRDKPVAYVSNNQCAADLTAALMRALPGGRAEARPLPDGLEGR